jgi:hypothetical protein
MLHHRTNLLERPPEAIDVVLAHPRQLRAYSAIRALIRQLRTLRTDAEYHEFQRVLFGHLFKAEESRGETVRNVKRLRAGRSVPSPPSGDWELELTVADRIVRQLRSVGDALAWRAFNFDRRFILALSRNQAAGPMVGKAGLERELGEVMAVWEHEKCFALLHGLTNALRIADLTKFTKDGPLLVEVKHSGRRIPRNQLQRMQRVVEVINSGAPLPGSEGDVDLFVSRQPFKTHLRRLREALALADRQGTASVRLGDRWAVSCVSAMSPALSRSDEGMFADSLRRREAMLAKARLQDAGLHRLRGVSVDIAARDAATAPFAIYPFDPDTCARLTCDLVSFEHLISFDRIAGAFEGEGFETDCRLPERSEETDPRDTVLIARRRDRTVAIHGSGISQVLFEMVDPRRFAAAVREITDRSTWVGPAIFTFTNERAVWR